MITTFDKSALKSLELAYLKAVECNERRFTFADQVLLTDYAKYLIEYLKTKTK